MHMFWHDDIADRDKAITLARLLQDREESVPGSAPNGERAIAGHRNK
jgi:hypothetical protein